MKNRIWIKLYSNNKIVKDIIFECDKDNVKDALLEQCKHLDISQAIWSSKNSREWQNHGITRFSKEDFIDDFEYDIMEICYLIDNTKKSI